MRLRMRAFAAFTAIAIVGVSCGGGGTTTPSASGPAASSGAPSAAAAVVPTRAVEFIISTAPGGGSDIYARFMQGVIEKNKLSPQPVQPVNKEGASGAVAFTYVFEKKGDMHYIMITLNSFFTTIITQKLPYKATDFTPIANLALDPFFLWVNEDSPWKTAPDVIKAAQDKGITVSGTGSKQEDEALFRRIEDVAKTKPFVFIPSQSGATVAAALAGHQGGVELTVNNPSEGIGLYQATPRKLRPICAFTPESPAAGNYKGLATCKSQGLDITDYYIMRAIMGPPGLSAAQTAFWVDVFKKVFDSAEWKKFMEDNALDPKFLSGPEFAKFIADYTKLHEDIAKKNNWVQ